MDEEKEEEKGEKIRYGVIDGKEGERNENMGELMKKWNGGSEELKRVLIGWQERKRREEMKEEMMEEGKRKRRKERKEERNECRER